MMDEDTAIWNVIRDLPDVDCLPLPARFFKKFGIAPREIENTKDYLATQYTWRKQTEPKELTPLILDEPQRDKDGKIQLVEMFPPEVVDVKVVQRPFEQEEGKTMVILPSLRDDSYVIKNHTDVSVHSLPQNTGLSA